MINMLSEMAWMFNLICVIVIIVTGHKDLGSPVEIRYEEKVVMARKLSARFIVDFPDERELRQIVSKKRSGAAGIIVLDVLVTLVELLIMGAFYEKIALLVISAGIVIYETVRIVEAGDIRRYTKLYGIVAGNEIVTTKAKYGERQSFKLVICYREPVSDVKARSITCDKETYDCLKLTHTCFVILDKGRFARVLVDDEG